MMGFLYGMFGQKDLFNLCRVSFVEAERGSFRLFAVAI